MLFPPKNVGIADGPNLDSFSRLRVSQPQGLFDAQFTYDLAPLLFEQRTSGSGASVAHDATNRLATLAFSSSGTNALAEMRSYEHFRYQPGKGQLVFITFNFLAGVTGLIKYAGYSDGTNGVEFRLAGASLLQFVLNSGTGAGAQTANQDDWNLDTLDGNGPSGIDLDIAFTQILVIDLQALYVGRVRVGFDIGGNIVYAHEFTHANRIASPYVQTANLPIRVGMLNAGPDPVSTTASFICCSISSEGGVDDATGYSFAIEGTVAAGSGAATHILSLQPATTFNSIANRSRFVLESVDMMVTGNFPVLWQLAIGQALTQSPAVTWTAVNTTYSAMQYNTAATLSGSPAAVLAQGYVGATASQKAGSSTRVPMRYPITLDAAGAVRVNGRLSVIVTGLGGAPATRCSLNWKEIR